jgi:type II secretory pathway predicted ATPase ExeA
MYEGFYGFRSKPFSLLPDPEFLYPSRKHEAALNLLDYGLMNQASFCVITGDIGTGKTTVIRQFLRQMESNRVVGCITNTHPSFGELLQWILMAFNIECPSQEKVDMYKTFIDFLIKQYAANRRTVLIIDEAQNMSLPALEELRMLSNVNSEKDQVLQIILTGQPGLRDKLRDPSLEQFAQRIGVDYDLASLDPGEIREYIRHRLTVAGGSADIFDDEACEAVFLYSGGIPRLANLLCDAALVYGYAEQAPRISAKLIEDVARDRQKSRILPLRLPVPMKVDRPYVPPPAQATEMNVNAVSGRKLRVAIASDSERQRSYLKMMIERSGLQVVVSSSIGEDIIGKLEHESVDVLLVDMDEGSVHQPYELDRLIDQVQSKCKIPVLFNDSSAAGAGGSLVDLGRKLSLKLSSLASRNV